MSAPLRFFVTVLAVFLLLPAVEAETRTWTSRDGRQITGEFVKADARGITIRKADGDTVFIKADLLSDGDLVEASKLARAADEEAARKRELDDEALEREKLLEGPLTYGLSDGAEDWPEDRRKRIVDAMEAAVMYFNEHADFEKHVTANNSPGTPTADANYDGWINWGGSINRRVALHEISHTLGIGTHARWSDHLEDGKWTGRHALEQLREFDGPDAVLYADRQHFWPYGLNFDRESDPESDLRFLQMIEAFRKDLGIE